MIVPKHDVQEKVVNNRVRFVERARLARERCRDGNQLINRFRSGEPRKRLVEIGLIFFEPTEN